MNNLIKEKIMIPSWKLIIHDTKIKKFYFLPWVLSIIFLTFLLVYQFIYTYVVLFWNKDKALNTILEFFHYFFDIKYCIEIIIICVIFLIAYFLLSPIFEWWLIKYIANKDKNIQLTISETFSLWLYNFLPLFEYNNIFNELKLISILNFYLFTLRFLGIEYLNIISYFYIIIFFFATILNILFIYSKYEMLIESKGIFEALWMSSKITLLNLRKTIKIYFLIFILNLRVVFNFIIFLAFPIIMVIAITLITSQIYKILAIIILSLLFIAFILFLWYLTSVLEIFIKAVWYYAYKTWKENIKKLKEI